MTTRGELPPDPLAEELDRFIERHQLARRGIELDRAPAFPRAEFEAMGADGWLGFSTPTEWGGRGLSLPRAGALLCRLAYRAGTVFAKLALQPEFSSVLRERGSRNLQESWFRPLCQGRRLIGNQITEPTAGSDAQALQLDARRDGDDYLLTGTKSEVAFAAEAEAAIVYARVVSGDSSAITAFLVPQTLPGIERSLTALDLGERWQRRGTVRYDGVRVSSDLRLGEEGQGFEYVRSELTRERALLAAVYLGVGRASWDEVVAYVGTRSVFGRPLSSQEAVSFSLVEDGARLDAAWWYVLHALGRLERGEPADAEAALGKWMATDTALTAIDHAIQFHGGRGYSGELPHEQRWRDVRSGAIAHGTSEVMHVIAAHELWPRASRPPVGTARTRGH